MRLSFLPLILALIAPNVALAEDTAKPAKVRKICREEPSRTGSHFRGKRVCKTEAEWKEYDQAEVSLEPASNGAPVGAKSTTSGN